MTGKGPCVAGSAFPSYCAAGDSAPLLRTRRRSLPAGDARGMHGAVGGAIRGWGVNESAVGSRGRASPPGPVTWCRIRGTGIIPGRASGGCLADRDVGSPVSLGEAAHAVPADADRPPAGDRCQRPLEMSGCWPTKTVGLGSCQEQGA